MFNKFNNKDEKSSYEQFKEDLNYSNKDSGFSNQQNFDSSEGNFGYKGPSPGEKIKSKHQTKAVELVSKKTLIITVIVCMVIMLAIFAAVLFAFGNLGYSKNNKNSNEISATNYTLAKATGSALSIQEIIAKNADAVVEIRTESVSRDMWLRNYVTEGAGSGVIIDSKGYILTCNHVIEGASNITVSLKDGTTHTASVIGADKQNDLAVIKIKGSGFTAAKYGNSNDLVQGDMVVAIGNPLGELGGSASAGIVSSNNRELTIGGSKMNLIQTDASVNPGNSGGGMFDDEGNLVGIVVAKSAGSEIEGLGFAIPINKAAKIAEDLIKNGKVSGRSAIGVSVTEITDIQQAVQAGVRNKGVYIVEVVSKEAKSAGLKKGDMIYYMDDTQIETAADLTDFLQKHKPGETVKVTVIRGEDIMKLKTKLVEAN